MERQESTPVTRISRSQLLKAAGIGAAAATIPGVTHAAGPPMITFPYYPQVSGRYSPESISDISRVLHTSEHTAAGVMYAALTSTSLNLKGNALLNATVQGALVQHQRHAEYMDSIGNPNGLKATAWFANSDGTSPGTGPATNPVKPTMPVGATDSQTAFFTAMEWLETLMVAEYIAAIREFAELGQPEVAKWMSQILGVEGGLRVLARNARAMGGDTTAIPPNDKAYETDYLLYVRDAVPALVAKGFLNGSGPALPIFSPAAAHTSPFTDVAGPAVTGVVQQAPNNATSSDVSGLPGPRS